MDTTYKENVLGEQNTIFEQHGVKYRLNFYVQMDKFSDRHEISEAEFIRIGGKYAIRFISDVNNEIANYTNNKSIRDFFETENDGFCIAYSSGFYGKCTFDWDYVFVYIARFVV
jgi:starvation-inducible outer membrane lipoprotein